MKIAILGTAGLLVASVPVAANDWEKFYTPLVKSGDYPESSVPPDEVASTGDIDRDLESMWRQGFAPVGYSYFSTSNSKTSDALRLAKKLKVRHLIVATNLTSSTSSAIPLTLPTSTTSYTSGNASAYGSGGYLSGRYSGTTTTYGSQTTYIPFTVNRYDKFAAYFAEVPKKGLGALLRDLTDAEIARLETRKAFAVRFVRDGSPAYAADILPGDIVLRVNGEQYDPDRWWSQVSTGKLKLLIDRGGSSREIEVTVPEDWR